MTSLRYTNATTASACALI